VRRIRLGQGPHSHQMGVREEPARPAGSTGDGPATRRIEGRLSQRIVTGMVALGFRQAVVKVASVLGGIVLARILSPSTFGAYAIVSFAVAAFTIVGDLGLAASLIQQDHEPTEHERRVAFAAQQMILGLAAGLIVLLSPVLAATFRMDSQAELVLRLLAVGLVVSSLRTLPATILERNLEFGRLAVAEASQVVTFQVIAIAMALQGYGIVSFGVAALIGTSVNTVLVNFMRPWRPGWAWDWPYLVKVLRFGLPYQGSNAVSFVKDAINPLFVGLLVGVAAVGNIDWAATFVGYPIVIVTILNRVYFPAFSRLRSRPDALRLFAAATIRWNEFVVVGLLALLLPRASFWTLEIFGPQWLPAVPILYWLAIAMPFAAAMAPCLAILNAHGRSREAFLFTIVWMVATWVLTVPAVALMGWMGFGVANALVQLTNPFLFRRIQACVTMPIWPSITKAVVAGGLAWLSQLAVAEVTPGTDAAVAVVAVFVGAATYLASWTVLSRAELRADLGILRNLGRPASRGVDRVASAVEE
jgi:O-antigen/teichoic acid export membrane protein